MAGPRKPLAVVAERLRSQLWPIPGLAAVISLVAAVAMSGVRPASGSLWWPGEAESGQALLQVLVGSSLTVVALVFSLQVVSLQLAASQYSPRLLRTYVRDGVTQAALAVLISTFVFSLVSLALFGAVDRPPRLNVTVAAILGLSSVAALLGVVAHIIASLRVETMMARIHADATGVIRDEVVDVPRADPAPVNPSNASTPVPAPRSGFVQAVGRDDLAQFARDADVLVVLDVIPGDQVFEGVEIGRVDGARDTAAAAEQVAKLVLIGHERTPDQDPRFGLTQLVDIGMRALSPGLNDPTTAIHAIGHLTDLALQVAGCAAGGVRRTEDSAGSGRLWEPRLDLPSFLEDICPPLIRAGAEDAPVLLALLRLLAVARERADVDSADAIQQQVSTLRRAAERAVQDPSERSYVLERADELR